MTVLFLMSSANGIKQRVGEIVMSNSDSKDIPCGSIISHEQLKWREQRVRKIVKSN